jgi:hypothetical protein
VFALRNTPARRLTAVSLMTFALLKMSGPVRQMLKTCSQRASRMPGKAIWGGIVLNFRFSHSLDPKWSSSVWGVMSVLYLLCRKTRVPEDSLYSVCTRAGTPDFPNPKYHSTEEEVIYSNLLVSNPNPGCDCPREEERKCKIQVRRYLVQ